ncbi:MAG: hypothetical protein HY270_11250 [Deltaproteobacteria bacterium]|nr:hypothetical protein [Deltaproteobacteria bacterium]
MRRQRGLYGLMGLAAMVGLSFIARPAVARVTTEQSASILVFAKVIADGTRDTIIQITNTSNNMRHAHCFYVDGAPEDFTQDVSPLNPPRWTETDFDIWLTKQQPTHWVVSTGRWDDPTDDTCRKTSCSPSNSGANNGGADCCDAGFDPGRVPPVGPHFTGELKCIEVDASGFPVPGNALKGEATLVTVGTGEVSKYNAVGLKGFDTNNMDGTLCLGGGVSGSCPSGAEYEACPQTWILDHPSIGAPDLVVDSQSFCDKGTDGTNSCSSVSTTLTVVPCRENFETQAPTSVTLQFQITNEYEQTFSASTTITCWASYALDEINKIFTVDSVAGTILQTRMRSAAGTGGSTNGGVIAVLEEAHTQCPAVVSPAVQGCTGATQTTSYAASNGHNSFADQSVQDIITIPSDQIQLP